jgi:hypothetical protein
MQDSENIPRPRISLADYLDVIDYSGEILEKDRRIADLELERDTLMVWFRHALHALADLTRKNRQLQSRNRLLSHEIRLWRDRALRRSRPSTGSDRTRRAA